MCKFFSAISNGKGKVLFFTLEDIQKIEKEGNPERYEDWNSHTSIAHFNGIKGAQEDKWNKWEYDCEKKELKIDGDYNANDDSERVQRKIEKYLADNNAIYVRKVFCKNSGDWNSGHRNSGHSNSGDSNSGHRNSGYNNSGHRNSGHRNSGHRNSGHRNSGHSNSGHWNSGYSNSGHWNSGHRNSGDSNSGDSNSGHWNSGDRNSGDRNSGDSNSGHWNSGDSNSGHWNSGDRNSGFCNSNEPPVRIFNEITQIKECDIAFPKYWYFEINIWVPQPDMTDEEKVKYWWQKTTEGYLRKVDYKEAWKLSFEKATKEDVAKTLKLPNFSYKVFEEVSGITKEMLDKKTRGDH